MGWRGSASPRALDSVPRCGGDDSGDRNLRSRRRRYDALELTKLRYIRAKALRLSLRDIAARQQRLLDGPAFCAAVRALVAARPDEVAREVAALTALSAELDAFLDNCGRRSPD